MKKPRLQTRVWVLILAAIAGICLLAILAPRRTPKQLAGTPERVDESSGQIAGTSERIDESAGQIAGTPEQIDETPQDIDEPSKGKIAAIYLDGVLVRRVDLDSVTEEEHYRVESHGGFNDILIQPGRICVASADCPDQICVLEGWLPEFELPIVCLPHDLLIEIEDSP